MDMREAQLLSWEPPWGGIALTRENCYAITKWFWVPHDVRITKFSLGWDLKADLDTKNQCLSSELILELLKCRARTNKAMTYSQKSLILVYHWCRRGQLFPELNLK